ncbi:LOW QUALITY PROTEIN: hypothetical protein PHPALM_30906 [Phytophthora palmivora]|uniref:Uncharacterized protein n=1 Tax=Phytophthora palmivora TaxID=4796 RepID=A0A2P4X3Z4_9STRA|nr:LOW QUALITY PROTEIN: hypothetical protein PHPALM_30906 [Phytophthora palmivora]
MPKALEQWLWVWIMHVGAQSLIKMKARDIQKELCDAWDLRFLIDGSLILNIAMVCATDSDMAKIHRLMLRPFESVPQEITDLYLWVYDKVKRGEEIKKDVYAVDQFQAMQWSDEIWTEMQKKNTQSTTVLATHGLSL